MNTNRTLNTTKSISIASVQSAGKRHRSLNEGNPVSYLKISMKDNFSAGLMKKLQEAGPRAAVAVAAQAGSTTEQHMSEEAKEITEKNLHAGIPVVVYPGPYARYLYYGVKMVDRETGRGPAHFFDKMGNEVIAFPKGSKLRPTRTPLKFSKSPHPKATAKWFEVSKAQNLEKWERVAGKAIDRELDK